MRGWPSFVEVVDHACDVLDLTGHLVDALVSATASASRKSFFWPLRKGFTNCPGTSFTSWPSVRS